MGIKYAEYAAEVNLVTDIRFEEVGAVVDLKPAPIRRSIIAKQFVFIHYSGYMVFCQPLESSCSEKVHPVISWHDNRD